MTEKSQNRHLEVSEQKMVTPRTNQEDIWKHFIGATRSFRHGVKPDVAGLGRINPGLLKNKLQLKGTLKRRCRRSQRAGGMDSWWVVTSHGGAPMSPEVNPSSVLTSLGRAPPC